MSGVGDVRFLYLQQEDAASTHGKSAACSGAAVNGGSNLDHAVRQIGTPGTTPVTVTIPAGATQAAWFFESTASGLTRWDPGMYLVPIEVATPSPDIKLEEVHLCRVDSSGASLGTLDSKTGLAMDLSVAGVVYVALETTVATAVSATDRLYVVCVFENTDGGAPHDIDLVPSQALRTPLVLDQLVRMPLGVLDLVGLAPSVTVAVAIEMPIAVLETLAGDLTQMQVLIEGAPSAGAGIGS